VQPNGLQVTVLSWSDFAARDEGAAAIEYALISALIAVVIVGSVTAIGGSLGRAFAGIDGALPAATSPSGPAGNGKGNSGQGKGNGGAGSDAGGNGNGKGTGKGG
jgi:Flp pilus assembly pilin Flp